MPLADRLEITQVHLSAEGDSRFPPIDPAIWRETARTAHPAGRRTMRPTMSSPICVRKDGLNRPLETQTQRKSPGNNAPRPKAAAVQFIERDGVVPYNPAGEHANKRTTRPGLTDSPGRRDFYAME